MSNTEKIIDGLKLAGLCLFAFSVVFSVSAVQAALFLVLAALLAGKYRDGTLSAEIKGLVRHPLFIPWAVYLGACLLAASLAFFPKKGFSQLNSDFLKYVCLATLLLAVKKDRVPLISRFYTSAALFSAVIGIYKMLQAVPGVSPNSDFRARAFMNPVRYGEIMAIATLFILAKLLLSRKEDSRVEKAFYSMAGVASFVAVILSQTRGAYLGLFAGLGCMFLFSKGARLRMAGLLLALLLIGGATMRFNPALSQRFTSMAETASSGSTSDEAINIRLDLWRLGAKMFLTHPIVGVGPDNVKPVFTKFKPDLIFGTTWGSLHNLYLHQATERGLVGLGALLFLFLAMFVFAFRLFRAAPGPFTLWAACVLPAHYVMNITEISFQHVHTSFAVFMALAFASAYSKGIPETN